MKKLFSISKEAIQYVEQYSKEQGVTQSQVIETALQLYMAIKNGISSDVHLRKNKVYIGSAHPRQATIDEF